MHVSLYVVPLETWACATIDNLLNVTCGPNEKQLVNLIVHHKQCLNGSSSVGKTNLKCLSLPSNTII